MVQGGLKGKECGGTKEAHKATFEILPTKFSDIVLLRATSRKRKFA
jgi:hypothetical protein